MGIAVAVAAVSCGHNASDPEQAVKIREVTHPLSVSGNGQYADLVVDYFKYYSLDLENDFPDIEHVFGTFESDGYTLAGHIYKPRKYKGSVFVLHGYLNHSGQLKNLIRFLIESGYGVGVFDLPGHGLSTGSRAAIGDFSEYSRALSNFVDVANKHIEGPYHLIGFSTGGSAAIDVLSANQGDKFAKVVLVAPLVRSVGWGPSKVGTKIFGAFVDSVPRMARKESSDTEYLEFVKRDPLQAKQVPLEWVRALHGWNDKIAELPNNRTKVKVIQGTNDTTVDWKFNIEFIKEHFSNAEVVLIEDGGHELLNESVDIRHKVLSEIGNYLGE